MNGPTLAILVQAAIEESAFLGRENHNRSMEGSAPFSGALPFLEVGEFAFQSSSLRDRDEVLSLFLNLVTIDSWQ